MTENKTNETQGADEMIITLEYDDGTEIETEVIGVFDVDGKEYIALLPQDESDDVYLYGYVEDESGDFSLIDIEGEDEFEKVVESFEMLMETAVED